MLNKTTKKIRRALEEGGVRLVIYRTAKNGFRTIFGNVGQPNYKSLVHKDDLFKVDWVKNPYTPVPLNKIEYSTAWVMSPPGKGSGGHLSIFRFLQALESAGHKIDIFLYSTQGEKDINVCRNIINNFFPKVNANIKFLEDSDKEKEYDAVFATGWETAYPVYLFRKSSQKFYFVQDYEPSFYATGSDSVLAENTYKFGFFGITAGAWLSTKLKSQFGMNSDFFTFGIDHDIYKLTNPNPRKDVFFYARPSTPRRAFELGILALEELSARNLGINIHLAGWDVSDRNITFKHQSYGIISPNELSNIYNKCAVGLVLSLTNMSLLPPELIACGTIPVINVGDNNKMVFDNKFCRWSEAMPSQIADALENAIEESASNRLPTIISASVKNLNWETSKEKFLRIFEGQMKNPK